MDHGVVVLVRGDEELARWTLRGGDGLDLEVVDELARWQLAARRLGGGVRLRSPSSELRELLDLFGLTDVVPELGLRQVVGEAEDGEEAGVEEVVVPDDPVA